MKTKWYKTTVEVQFSEPLHIDESNEQPQEGSQFAGYYQVFFCAAFNVERMKEIIAHHIMEKNMTVDCDFNVLFDEIETVSNIHSAVEVFDNQRLLEERILSMYQNEGILHNTGRVFYPGS